MDALWIGYGGGNQTGFDWVDRACRDGFIATAMLAG